MAGRALPAVSRRVEQFARRTATPVTLEELYRLGCGGPADRKHMARYLHREIAVRNAQLCKELQLLPFGLAQARGTARVMSWYSQYVDWLAEFPAPADEDGERNFAELLRKILHDSVFIVPTLGEAVHEVRDSMGPDHYEGIRSEISLILDRFFIKRIGLRFLLEHFLESAEAQPGVSGIIHSNVAVAPTLRKAGDVARQACIARCGLAPEVQVVGDGHGHYGGAHSLQDLSHNRQFTYVPTHLSFMCAELLKNACEAVVKHNAPNHLPPVRAIFAHGDEEVSIKISDQGGGIARSDMHLAWSYFDLVGSSSAAVQDTAQGSGLPLARLHARYYGGDLVLKSMEGFGTDAYLFMNRLGQNCEKLPPGVRLSPAQSDSSLGQGESISLDSLGAMSDQEAAFLDQCLVEHRKRRQWQDEDSISGL